MRGATATGVTIQPHQIYRPCHAERLACFIIVTYETSFTMHTATDNFTKYCACHAERPACFIIVTYMKRHLQCAEQQVPPFNLTKCCASHEKWHGKISKKMSKNRWNVNSNAGTIREWSYHDPTVKPSVRNPPRKRGYLSSSPRAFSIEKYNISRPSIQKVTKCCTCHEKWHLNLAKCCTCHKNWHLNFTKCCTCHQKWHLKFTKGCTCHEKWHLSFTKRCTCHEKSHLNLNKYCACHAKWFDCLILVTNETSFTIRGATGVPLQPHQILRLPRKMTLQNLKENARKLVECIANAGTIRKWSDRESVSPQPSEIPCRAHHEHFLLKNTTFRAPASIQKVTKCCTCHEKWHLNLSPSAAPATKSNTWTSPSPAPATKSHTWSESDTRTLPSAAPDRKRRTWASPNTAPATQNDSTA